MKQIHCIYTGPDGDEFNVTRKLPERETLATVAIGLENCGCTVHLLEVKEAQ